MATRDRRESQDQWAARERPDQRVRLDSMDRRERRVCSVTQEIVVVPVTLDLQDLPDKREIAVSPD